MIAVPLAYAKDRRGGAKSTQSAPLSEAEIEQARTIYARTCAGCHGPRLEGAVGPSLVSVRSRYPLAKIDRIAQRGKGKNKPISMPAGLVSPGAASLLARWLAAGPKVAVDSPALRERH
jgi:mono/diheme cytochrome c family protein